MRSENIYRYVVVLLGVVWGTYGEQSSVNTLWGLAYGMLGKLDRSLPYCLGDGILIVEGSYDLYKDYLNYEETGNFSMTSLAEIVKGGISIYHDCKQTYLIAQNLFSAINTTRNQDSKTLLRDFLANIVINTPEIIVKLSLIFVYNLEDNYFTMGKNLGAGLLDLINSYQFNLFSPPIVDNTEDFWGGFLKGVLQGGINLNPIYDIINDYKSKDFTLWIFIKIIFNALLSLYDFFYYISSIVDVYQTGLFEHLGSITSFILRIFYNYTYVIEVNLYAVGYDIATVLVYFFPDDGTLQ